MFNERIVEASQDSVPEPDLSSPRAVYVKFMCSVDAFVVVPSTSATFRPQMEPLCCAGTGALLQTM